MIRATRWLARHQADGMHVPLLGSMLSSPIRFSESPGKRIVVYFEMCDLQNKTVTEPEVHSRSLDIGLYPMPLARQYLTETAVRTSIPPSHFGKL